MRNVILIFAIIICVVTLGCNNAGSEDKSPGDSIIKNSQTRLDTIGSGSKDTIVVGKDEYFNTLDTGKELRDYLKTYNDSIRIDTTIVFDGKFLRFYFRHYCLHDSSLTIPFKYVRYYGLKKLITHNFQSSVKIEYAGKLIIDTLINRDFFKDERSDNLGKYGVLKFTHIDFLDKSARITYTIGIPLSDVGRNFELSCYYNGALSSKEM